MSGRWVTSPRWNVAHLIAPNTMRELFRGTVYVWTVCGRRVNYERLGEWVDIPDDARCPRCQKREPVDLYQALLESMQKDAP